MTFVVVYDANVLYGNTLRDLLIRLAMTARVQARWTNGILDEMQRNLAANRPDIPAEKLDKLRRLMNSAVRDCLVEGYEPLIEGLKLPDADDRHVLAAAIKVGAKAIVTSNGLPCRILGSMGHRGEVARRLRPRPDRLGRKGRLGVCAADCGLTDQPAGDR
ncbi:PIN domain-containing protein [Nonomuraea sp. NPDC050227]|uniref:PIN domain-containing protein n=1 Tax=Nonomuraea sp. NPDC050227 TaxID=3364360 RepID=UPI0037A8F949